MIRVLLREQFQLNLSLASVGRLLKQLGLTCQRPLFRATEQDPERVRQWLEQEYPTIREQARHAGAEIYFGDEAGVRSDCHAGTTWGVKGKTPVVRSTGQRSSVNMISAVSARGGMRFMLAKGKVNGPVWTLAALWAKRMCVFPKPPLILLVFFPGDVTGMRASEQSVPFLLRQFYLMNPVQRFARAGFAIREGSCIAGVM